MRLPILTLPAMIVAIGLLSACGGSAQSDTLTPAPTLAVTAETLPSLVLDVSTVTVDATVLPYDAADSGPKTAADYTAEAYDAEWFAENLEKYNWQAGYYQDFGTSGQGSPVFNASVLLDLLDTPEHAAEAFDAKFEHISSWEGRTLNGATFESVKLFRVDELGALGVTIEVRLDTGDTYTMTNIDFVRGPLVVDIGTATTDARNLVGATQELMQLVNERLIAAGLTP